ncbi:MAG: Gfo/Idh/MocA family oxidoreductase [Vallitaleaceae bacterium]|nr:Gfo/Idh/MocA family oxidoreductase [Vallitaleaceae bacterium]
MINVGVVGCGSIARKRHATEYLANLDVNILGFNDHYNERADYMTKEFGGKVYDSVDEMFADPSIDAVSICAANAFHADLTIKALNSGKHVLCEKPMAITLKDCEDMVAAAHKNNKQLMIGHNQRLSLAHIKAKQILDSGELGRVISFSTTFGHQGPEMWGIDKSADTWFFKKSSAAFGSMADLGIHKIDLLIYLISGHVTKVYADLTTLDKKFTDGTMIEVDDNSVSILTFDNGTIGTVTTSWTYYGEESNATILYCEKGIIRLYANPTYSLEIIYSDNTKVHYELDKIQTNVDDIQTSSGVIDMFIDGVVRDEKTVLDGAIALESMKVVFACLKSSEEGRPIIM